MKSPDSSTDKLSLWQRLRLRFNPPNAKNDFEELVDDYTGDIERLTDHEKQLITAALDFDDLTASEICVSRSDIHTLNITDNFKTVWAAFIADRHSRMPVIDQNLDNVVGILTLKDLIPLIGTSTETNFDISKVLRPVTFVPENMPLPNVLSIMQRDRTPFVLVADEYGGTAGLITLKDAMAELVGELEDEHSDAVIEMKKLNQNTYLISARTELIELSKALNLPDFVDPETSVIESLGGLLAEQAGRVPQVGDVFTLVDGITAEVTEADARRVLMVKLKLGKAHLAQTAA